MAEDFGFVRALGDFFGLVGEKTLNRIGSSLTAAEAGNYKFEKAVTDTLGFYNDLLGAWFGLTMDKVVTPTPSVTMKIVQGTTSASATVSLGSPPAASLDKYDLLKIGLPAAISIPKANIALAVSASGDLTVTVSPISATQAKGLYKSLVFVAATNEPILEMRLRITS